MLVRVTRWLFYRRGSTQYCLAHGDGDCFAAIAYVPFRRLPLFAPRVRPNGDAVDAPRRMCW